MTTVSEVRKLIEESAQAEGRAIAVHDAVRGVLGSKRWAGKKITRAIGKHIREALGLPESAVVWIGTEYKFDQTYRLRVWGKDTPFPTYTDAPCWTLPATGSPEGFDVLNRWSAEPARERNRKRAAVTDDQIADLCDVADRLRDARKHLGMIFKFDGPFRPDRYSIEKLLTGDES